jgi:phosphohistidine phosphatase
MNRIFILRHAKASDHTTNDHDRPLTEIGQRQAHILGQWVREQNVLFDAVFTSSSLRTVQTAANLDLPTGYTIVPRLYSASAQIIAAVIRESGLDFGTLLVIAHNPGVSDLVFAAGSKKSMGTCEIVELSSDQALTEFSGDMCLVASTFRPEV